MRPVPAVVYPRRQFVDEQPFRRDKTLHRHDADITQFMHDGGEHGFRLFLLFRVGLRERYAGAQNPVLVQVVRQRVEHGAAVMGACAD